MSSVGSTDFSRCFAAALDEAFAPAARPIGLLAGGGGMVGAALGIGNALPWLRQPMSVAASAAFPCVADRLPKGECVPQGLRSEAPSSGQACDGNDR